MITITGEPKEIAALVVALQEWRLSELKEGACLTNGIAAIDSDFKPGSKRFFEAITVPGIKEKIVNVSMGCVHVVLIVDAKSDAESLKKQYMGAFSGKIPVGQNVAVSVAKLCS